MLEHLSSAKKIKPLKLIKISCNNVDIKTEKSDSNRQIFSI